MKGKIISTILIALLLVATISSTCFAASAILKNIDGVIQDNTVTVTTDGMTSIAGKVIKIIRYAAVIIGAILIAVFGIKFMIGSAEEKAEYKKSFVPLIIGIVVVFGSTYIAELLFNTFTL